MLWEVTDQVRAARLKRFVVPQEEQLDFESTKLWRKVSEAIANDDQNAATEEKTVLEEAQRVKEHTISDQFALSWSLNADPSRAIQVITIALCNAEEQGIIASQKEDWQPRRCFCNWQDTAWMQAGTCGEDWDEDREGENDDPTAGETPNKDATVRSPIPARGKLTILQDTSHSDGREQQANAAGPVGAAAELLNSMRHDPARRRSRLRTRAGTRRRSCGSGATKTSRSCRQKRSSRTQRTRAPCKSIFAR